METVPLPHGPLGPRERALEEGVDALGDVDLLSILLGAGLSGRPASLVAAGLLERFSGAEGLLQQGPAVLAEHPGIGLAKALRICSALELGRRVALRAARPRATLQTSLAVASYLRPAIGALEHEEMWLLSLDGRNHLKSARRIAQGGLHGCAVAPVDVFRAALAEAASAIVLVHNHPSGDPSPSPSDIGMTRLIADAGAIVGIALVDHVILTADGRHSSMLDLGVLVPFE